LGAYLKRLKQETHKELRLETAWDRRSQQKRMLANEKEAELKKVFVDVVG
jgi:adenine-specific DNA methylase